MIFAKPKRAFLGYRVRSDQRAAFCDQSVDVVHERRAVIGKRKLGNPQLAKRLHKIVVLRIPAVAVDLDLGSLACAVLLEYKVGFHRAIAVGADRSLILGFPRFHLRAFPAVGLEDLLPALVTLLLGVLPGDAVGGHLVKVSSVHGGFPPVFRFVLCLPAFIYSLYLKEKSRNIGKFECRIGSVFKGDDRVHLHKPAVCTRTRCVGAGYRRGKMIYGTDDALYPDGLDIKRTISQNDLDIIAEIYDHAISELPDSMKEAICWFICAVAVMRYHGYEKPISMLVHTSQKQACHDAIAEVLSAWINSNRSDTLLGMCAEVYARETQTITKRDWLDQFADGYGVDEDEIRDYPTFENITPYITELLRNAMKHIKMDEDGDLQYHSGLHLVIDNCSKNGVSNGDDFVRLAYPEPGSENYPTPAPAFIIIGGSTLSRGLTIEGLVSTFFLRASCQADTLMQMGRWFGYRRGYELLPRVWMTAETISKFRFLSQLEVELREDLKKYMITETRPDEYGPRIILSPKVSWLRLTSRNHMKNAVNAEMDYSGAKPQTTIFDNSVTKQQQNIAYTEEFLAALPGMPVVSALNNCIFWENISLDIIYRKLLHKRFSFSNRSRVFNEMEAFCEWIRQVLKDDTLNKWTVVVAGRDGVDDIQQKNPLGYWTVAGHTIGLVNRSKKDIEDDTCIDIGVLRSIKDLLADIPEEYLKGHGNITKQEQVDDIRKAAGRDNIPMLLPYLRKIYSKAINGGDRKQ